MKRRSLLKTLFAAPIAALTFNKEEIKAEENIIPGPPYTTNSSGSILADEHFAQFHKILDLNYQQDRKMMSLLEAMKK